MKPESAATADRPARRVPTVLRAVLTSDVTRVRDMFLAASVAAAVMVAALTLTPSKKSTLSPGPLGRPHVEAGLGCADCHERADGAAGAVGSCVSCHGATAHVSTRAAHRALAAQGKLVCIDCHAAHGSAEGVTFLDGARYLRWAGERTEASDGVAGPRGATVPLVPIAACARCHDVASATDPVASCLVGGAEELGISRCFDEHQDATHAVAAAGRIACARQHGASRVVAWEAADQVLARGSLRAGFFAPTSVKGPWSWLAAAFAAGAFAFVSSAAVRKRRRRPTTPTSGGMAPPRRVRLPQINATTCLGCYACVDACPFDVLEIQRYVAVVARPSDCCGVVLCQQACPNGSLTIAEGEPIRTRPRIDDHLESLDGPGVFVAGDLSGVPLIKNAIAHGVRVIDRIAERPRTKDGVFDVAIIGAGPAGLSASLRAEERGLSYVTLEQASVAASIRSFPRNKLVFDQPLQLPVEGDLWLRECTKEELLAQWTRIVRRRKLKVREGQRVADVARREDGRFVLSVEALDGTRDEVSAAHVVLAIGKRGTPRPLACDVAEGAEGKVFHALADARSFASQRVLVVGLGDSAMETAIALAHQPGTVVTVAYRGAAFARGRPRNVAELKALTAKGKVRLLFESHVERIEAGSVVLNVGGLRETVGNDAVFVMIGGIPAWELVLRAGVTTEAGVVPLGDDLNT